MKTNKMSLANIQGKLSRVEMRNITAGSGKVGCPLSCIDTCTTDKGCKCYNKGTSNEYCG